MYAAVRSRIAAAAAAVSARSAVTAAATAQCNCSSVTHGVGWTTEEHWRSMPRRALNSHSGSAHRNRSNSSGNDGAHRPASSVFVGRVQLLEVAFRPIPALHSHHYEPFTASWTNAVAIAAGGAPIEPALPILTAAQLADAAQRQKLFAEVASNAGTAASSASSAVPPASRRFLINKKLLPSLFGGEIRGAETRNLVGSGTASTAALPDAFGAMMDPTTAASATSSSLVTSSASAHSLAALSSAAPSAPLSHLVFADSSALRRRASSTAVAPKPVYRQPTATERTWLDASTTGQWDQMQRIRDSASPPVDPNIADPRTGATALHQLAALGADDAIEALLVSAASKLQVDARASNLATPLHWAAGIGHSSTVSLLLRAGADPRLRSVTWNHTVFGRGSGQTPSHWAAESGHLSCVQLLHEASPATAAMLDERESSPLESAQKAAQTEVARFLTEAQSEEYVCVEIAMRWSGERIVQPSNRQA